MKRISLPLRRVLLDLRRGVVAYLFTRLFLGPVSQISISTTLSLVFRLTPVLELARSIMRKFLKKLLIRCCIIAAVFVSFSCKQAVNTVYDSHFTEDGYCLDSPKENFVAEIPNALGFYVEVSGSMNGFFRSNKA
ncbi:MAG: hypothetical protein ACI4QG_04280, partial [Candidatus Cryptobacteroides sp.]